MSVILALLTFVLVVISLLMVLLILMQRAKSDGGVGAALGGGIAEATLGGEAGNVLSKATTWGAVLFFVIAFGLYLGRIHQDRVAKAAPAPALPSLAPATPSSDSLSLPSLDTPATTPPVEGSSLLTPPAESTAPALPPAETVPADATATTPAATP